MSSDLVISVEGLSKSYQIYDHPRDRLKQFILPRLQRFAGQEPCTYYRDFWALRDVNFEVRRGESVGIVGRNGSGKSTLLQIITGTLSPTSGSVNTVGRIAALLELGSGFNPDFTGRENVYLNGSLLGLTRAQIDERFDLIAGFADIGEHLDQPVKAYSTGMLVRLAFAVQVQVEPDILIVDEALAVGDWLFQKRCFQRIEKLLADGTTLLFVSHDQESVRTLTHRALLLSHGAVRAWGVSSSVVLEYRKLLHEDEIAYFGAFLPDTAQAEAEPVPQPASQDQTPAMAEPAGRSEQMSFGEGQARVVEVQVLDGGGNPASIFYPGDKLTIRVTCRTRLPASRLNVAVRLRNKEGVKIYSWGTLNQDAELRATGADAPLFWERTFAANETFSVDLSCDCPLGMNLYEVQASVSHEETPDYMAQRMLHWVDEAAFFQVLLRRDEHFFGGVADLRMRAVWN